MPTEEGGTEATASSDGDVFQVRRIDFLGEEAGEATGAVQRGWEVVRAGEAWGSRDLELQDSLVC